LPLCNLAVIYNVVKKIIADAPMLCKNGVRMDALPIELTAVDGPDRPVHIDLRTCAPGRSRPIVIVCHGFLGYKRWGFFPYVSERLAEAGYHVITISFSMNGVDERTGRFSSPVDFARNTISREIDDLRRVCRFVRRGGTLPTAVPGKAWAYVGHSRGGSVMILVAAEFPEVRSLVTWSTPGRLDRYSKRRKELWKRDGALIFTDARSPEPLKLDYSYYEDIDRNRAAFDLAAALSRLGVPHLMVHGEGDAAVTVRAAARLLAAPRGAPRRFEVIHGAGHTFNVKHPMARPTAALEHALALTEAWLAETLPVTKEENQ
jgi:pimeloyl-ACP methyl ester carboxylesterase